MRSLRSASPLLSLASLTLSVMVLAGGLAAGAQHAGPGHAGAGVAAPRGGVAPSGRPGMASPVPAHGGPGMSAAPAARGNFVGAPGRLFPPPGITSTRPVFYSNGIRRYGSPDRRGSRGGYGGRGLGFVALGYPGYLDFGYDPDFLDPTYKPNDAAVGEGSGLLPDAAINPQPPSTGGYPGYSYAGYPEGAGYPADSGYRSEPEPTAPTEAEPAPTPTPFLAAPVRRAPAPAPAPLPEEDAVTIIFKDGRPPEQIHNYALTRTALYITAGKVRTIPVDDIDLAATEKANAKAGVEFQLPTK